MLLSLSLSLCISKPTPPAPILLSTTFSFSRFLFANKPRLTTPSRMSSTAAAAAAALPADQTPAQSGSSDDVLVQYVVLRRDLIDSWPLGSVVTQGCHAAVAAVWVYREHPETVGYCSEENLDHMHKVTLEVKGETQLKNLAEKLQAASIQHKLWIEQPENIPTCLATRPYPKSQVAAFFKKLKLCK